MFRKAKGRTSGPAATVMSTRGFLGGGGRLFFCTAFNQALTRLLLLALRLYVNRPPLAVADSCWPRTDGGCPSSHRIVDHGDGGPAAAWGGKTYNIIARRRIFNSRKLGNGGGPASSQSSKFNTSTSGPRDM